MSPAGENLLRIAQVLKSNGTDGALIIGLQDFGPEDIDTQEPVFIYFDGLPVPFYFESFQEKGRNRALVRLTGVSSLKDAEELVGQGIFLQADALDGEEEGFEALIGWMLLDKNREEIGEITDFEDIPGNPCLYVETSRGQIMIPLHEELILEVDEERQQLVMDVPAGLLA